MIHEDADRKSGPDGEGRLDVELPPDDLLPGLTERVGRALTNGLDEVVLLAGRPCLGSDVSNSIEY